MAESSAAPWTLGHAFVDIFPGYAQVGPQHRTVRVHGTTDWLLIYTLDGAGVFQHAGINDVALAGDALLLMPGTPHHYFTGEGAEKWEYLWAHFHVREHWIPWLDWPERSPGLKRLTLHNPAQRDRIVTLLRQSVALYESSQKRALSFAMNRLEEALLVFGEANTTSGILSEPRVDRAMKFIRENLAAPLTVATIADATGLSLSRLSHLFTQHVGQSPQAYVEMQRVARSKLMLESTGRSIDQIARDVGIKDASYFTRRFRVNTGFSPTAYRKHCRAKGGVKYLPASAENRC